MNDLWAINGLIYLSYLGHTSKAVTTPAQIGLKLNKRIEDGEDLME